MRAIALLFAATMLPAAALLDASPASAGETDFDGPRAGLIGGLDRTDFAPGAGAESAAAYGVQLGYDRDFGSFVLGAEADAMIADARTTRPGLTSNIERYLGLAVRAGYKPTAGTLLFARAGLANTRIALSPGADFSGTGWAAGGGGEVRINGRYYVRAEYRFSDYGSNVRGQQILGGIGLRF